MKTVTVEIPEGKRAEWVNGVLTLIDETPVEHKFNVGDRVLCRDGAKYKISGLSEVSGMPVYSVLGFDHFIISEAAIVELVPPDIAESKPAEFKFRVGDKVFFKAANQICTVEKVIDYLSAPAYEVSGWDGILKETAFEPVPRDITESIKTFDDAYDWCFHSKHYDLCQQYTSCNDFLDSDNCIDIVAFLKLRIITCALNEGWEPSEKEDGIAYAYAPKFKDEKLRSIPIGIGVYGDSSAKLSFKSEFLAAYAATQFADIYADFCGAKRGQ